MDEGEEGSEVDWDSPKDLEVPHGDGFRFLLPGAPPSRVSHVHLPTVEKSARWPWEDLEALEVTLIPLQVHSPKCPETLKALSWQSKMEVQSSEFAGGQRLGPSRELLQVSRAAAFGTSRTLEIS